MTAQRKKKPNPADVMVMLRRIESGDLRLRCNDEQTPAAIYCSNVPYVSAEGHELVIFNDCGDWDYIDNLTMPDGSHADFDDIWDDPKMAEVKFYRPSDAAVRRYYGIPGYLSSDEPAESEVEQVQP